MAVLFLVCLMFVRDSKTLENFVAGHRFEPLHLTSDPSAAGVSRAVRVVHAQQDRLSSKVLHPHPFLDPPPFGRPCNVLRLAQGMVAVDHLISAVKTAINSLPSEQGETNTRGLSEIASRQKLAAEATGGSIRMLRRKASQAAALAEAVRRQLGRLAVDVADSGELAGGQGAGKKGSSASFFRWSDGVLVEALERGDWIVLDGANLCSAR